MGQDTRYTPLPDSPSDPRVTDLSKPFNVPASTGPQAIDAVTGKSKHGDWRNRNVTQTIPIGLIAGVSQRVLVNNPRRTGLIIENKDATQPLNYSFANDLQSFGLVIAAGGSVLLDFTCPSDALYLFCGAANIQACVAEISRAG
jgi:hypothetical protein